MSPPTSRPSLSNATSYAERPVETARFNACHDIVRDYGEFQEKSTSATPNHTVSYQSSLPTEEEIPTFMFGRPFVDQTTSMPPHPRVAANRYQTPVLWACGGHAADRSEEESETEYDPATKAHFRQHLGIIDCSKALHSHSQQGKWLQGKSSALQDYETQLRLLEQQNREHVMKARGLQHKDAETWK
ncbi:uncharacterized protein Z520_04877 [Fonsecaea multimorphosa CBS 102226]|uniref:Uncharacterized protein n=1 Tax=Fonsecaea multimorphosa CBS 102226 TaxID=1442371 RepID=A0A0D2IQP2_9EURO|nr:uncharacterized protein Z520_04877 [Fonsecaea multimorphosa CBS 102226]KIX99301.1 hypothetical protein Z520_04877 [Fonsecaea multimorphosa CBS 102226]OAL25827.1 hypothetical protein AYO22_04621 [Fonsecaea multimorphosa]